MFKFKHLKAFSTITIAIVTLCTISPEVKACDKCCHAKSWNTTMGLTHSCSTTSFHPMWKTWEEYQRIIDDRSYEIQREVIRTYKARTNGKDKFITHSCGHRTYLHWGFHADPYHIERILSSCINQWDTLDAQSQRKLINKCKSEKIAANNDMFSIVGKSTNLHGQQKKALAAILYDVHILLDWQDKIFEPLAEPRHLKSEISNAVNKLFRHKSSLNHKLQKELNFALHSSTAEKAKAKNLLNVLQKSFPKALWETYGNTFPKKFQRFKNIE